MNRINRILQHRQYKDYVGRIEEYEKDRIFCKHDMGHFLDVCRLAEILYLQECLGEIQISTVFQNAKFTEGIYAAGLLHDIGRWQEYETGICHETASAELATDILSDCGFSYEESEEILKAIRNHRNKEIKEEVSLSGILYRADKMSRACFSCKAEAECDWDIQKKNMEIVF